MSVNREPRRIERAAWEDKAHLGALDSDIDELHNMRQAERVRLDNEFRGIRAYHSADMERIEKKFDNLINAIVKATIAVLGGVVVGSINVIVKVLGL